MSVQNGVNYCNYCKSSCHEDTSGFFATKTTNPPHWTLYQCFSAFRSIWVHLGSFRNCMKVGAKHTELINTKVRATKSRCNFSQQTHLIHPIGPKTHVLVCFIMFGCIWDRFVTA